MYLKTVYPGQIPLETDLLDTNQFAMVGLAKLAAAILGTGTLVNGLTCSPTSPASLQVQISPGEIYSLQNLHGTAYSSIPADTAHQIVKQGIMFDSVTLSCASPPTNGHSICYLVQATYQDVDSNSMVLPYYNASNPAQAYSGQNNSGSAQSTVRQSMCSVSVKAGVSAPTNTQTVPPVDSGYVGLYSVTVAFAQTTITSSNITPINGAPFISEKINTKISQATGDSRYATQSGFQQNSYSVANATGTSNAITASYTPSVTALTHGLTLKVRASSANTTPTPTFTPNSATLSAKTIVKGSDYPLVAGDICGAGHWIELQYDLTLDKWVLLNPATSANIVTLFSSLMSPQGYQGIAGGLIIQWMPGLNTAASGYQTLSLPIAFPNANLMAQVSNKYASAAQGGGYAFISSSTTQVTVARNNVDNSNGVTPLIVCIGN